MPAAIAGKQFAGNSAAHPVLGDSEGSQRGHPVRRASAVIVRLRSTLDARFPRGVFGEIDGGKQPFRLLLAATRSKAHSA